ncbi:hypothetical protein BTO20_36585 (plasmid) [Mycobacterium dioxanotrophicus]|uniref:Pentapeptide repeat-containing protein n=1 Tax=Mycobacterium dioxanotrophicus TaxID=482462 RepID=A0A1Y0CFY3_9MYCO|nr:hypothetical protein BTO20_36585 [Mycobacterium dioxanotrophicus]
MRNRSVIAAVSVSEAPHFEGADLTGANLTGADLENATATTSNHL